MEKGTEDKPQQTLWGMPLIETEPGELVSDGCPLVVVHTVKRKLDVRIDDNGDVVFSLKRQENEG